MKLEVLGCYGGESPDCLLTCLLINDTIALDAGCLSKALELERQVKVRHLILTHSHIDHTNAIPFFLDNVFGTGPGLEIHASGATIYAIRKYLFNWATWPDFARLPNHLVPAVRFNEVESDAPFEIEGVRFTPIEVNHAVPTYGFLIEQDGAAVLWSSDTGPTDRLWQVANSTAGLQAVCVDVSFGRDLQQVADDSKHLTPATLEKELTKLKVDVPILLHHLKPPFIKTIEREVEELGNPSISFLEQGATYHFTSETMDRS